MKKTFISVLLLLFFFTGYCQRKRSVTWTKHQDITNTRNFIWHGDTIDFESIQSPIDQITIDNSYVKLWKSGVIIDSSYWDYSQEISYFSLDSNMLNICLSDKTDTIGADFSAFTSKLDTVVTDSTIGGNGTSNSPLTVSVSDATKSVFRINLPSTTKSITSRNSGATEGEDYPSGWSLASIDDIHLKITHNLGRRVSHVSVCSVTGTEERRLIPGSTAYANYFTDDDNTLTIESFAPLPSPVVIYITFAQ